MPISARIVVQSAISLLAVGFLSLLLIVGATIWLGERARVYFDQVIEARIARSAAVELRDSLRTAESSQRGFLITGNEIYLAPYDSAKNAAVRHLGTLHRALAASPNLDELLRRLTTVMTEKFGEMDRTVALKNERSDDDAL